jgi:hypothetical protein
MCCSVVGKANLAAILWLHDLQELDAIESNIARAFPHALIEDRWMLPRFAKRIGHLLTPEGLHADFVRPDQGALPFRLPG